MKKIKKYLPFVTLALAAILFIMYKAGANPYAFGAVLFIFVIFQIVINVKRMSEINAGRESDLKFERAAKVLGIIAGLIIYIFTVFVLVLLGLLMAASASGDEELIWKVYGIISALQNTKYYITGTLFIIYLARYFVLFAGQRGLDGTQKADKGAWIKAEKRRSLIYAMIILLAMAGLSYLKTGI
ncbi:MAG: hypothetical protein CVV21_05645 [Candidatus Goldiibacteriota bacterium HGW-Goldbacteria-1]|jgi:hypothetical protein|nr:MAG: hypothetical protein CVV21_05645 [Candidatus Goldiibacteriota bacterium HGW-Goldbacteria-1]